jgi:inositol phosphorylceramide synthase catalytic subunit
MNSSQYFYSRWRENWTIWWKTHSWFHKNALPSLMLLYLLTLILLNALEPAHLWGAFILFFLVYGGPVTFRVKHFFLPILLTGLIYDSQALYSEKLQYTIHVIEPYLMELKFFGITTASGKITPNELFQSFYHPILDLIAGLAYIVYLLSFFLVAGYFYFWASYRGTAKRSAQYIYHYSFRITWAFLVLNVIGYITYYLYPAAPPWYVSFYGFSDPSLSTPPNPAGSARFDQILGLPIFQNFYGQSANVFAAIPSLHVAYPLLAVFYSFKLGALQMTSLGFYFTITFGAIYLNHHYVIDLVLGSAYALIVPLLLDKFLTEPTRKGGPSMRNKEDKIAMKWEIEENTD